MKALPKITSITFISLCGRSYIFSTFNYFQMSEEDEVCRGELRALIRHKVLTGELENTQNDLQTLR